MLVLDSPVAVVAGYSDQTAARRMQVPGPRRSSGARGPWSWHLYGGLAAPGTFQHPTTGLCTDKADLMCSDLSALARRELSALHTGSMQARH